MQGRWYHPGMGRFLALDPVRFVEGNPASFNRYAYANNNPYKYVDPDGELPILVPIAIFVAKEIAGEVFEQATGLPAPTVKGLGKAAAKRIIKNSARGRASEARKLAERGLDKNKKKLPGPEGNTIPDAIDPVTGNLVEVKDVKRLSNTKQMRNQVAAAEERGVKLEIDTGTNTKVSKALENNDSVKIIRHNDLGNGN